MIETRPGIYGFFGQFRFLSNFFMVPMEIGGKLYKSNEHWYQASKAKNESDHEHVRLQHMPGTAKIAGREIDMRPDFDRDAAMWIGIHAKFDQNPKMMEKLLATQGNYLEETNTWGDTYWGVCRGKGENRLGQILMMKRDGNPLML